MASLHVSLSDEMRSYVEEQVRGGRYHNHSEFVRDLIRHDQERRDRARVEALLLEGIESGRPEALGPADWQAVLDEALTRAASKAGAGTKESGEGEP